MSKTWYPVINYEKCIGCLACVNFCPHGVYDVKDKKPIVVRPEECVDFCKGCLKGACPTGAISFVGDKVKIMTDGGELQ
ncbi:MULTISPECIES: 4Fe-4S dicluster domain-containing protein [Dictyoglomus]|jgi:NAD-dependent dihydropyrimidine dehydrogenase PreA subunit|uniref:4Fe-4S ferredoxin iron-sulfur binding domain protein n=1 Tax=Dictyoglomus turgidum (strain DSM 6724 / Z-1310) TaxID=515635 RepID=B8E1X5_DICTD|nr:MULTISPECIES: ferredoxin family protein [Dictyoglomus]ACK41758.1 4Fe-4S ferredoxin iron-sulfur binding domain protein [Dictyoglomus turgidum DSM 6724]PNV79522.1 MAG: ferredoxin family protein [Dictyoglomus turgidum]HBU31744.1 ferredoxin family protein [Dictyoglomus sp.]